MGIYIKDSVTGLPKKISGGIEPGTYITKASIRNDLVTTDPGAVLDASQGKVLDEKITAISSNIGDIDNIEVIINTEIDAILAS